MSHLNDYIDKKLVEAYNAAWNKEEGKWERGEPSILDPILGKKNAEIKLKGIQEFTNEQA